jgi:hypothetical protein
MKKITLITVLITVLISCSKDTSISNGTVPKSGTFSIDNSNYKVENIYVSKLIQLNTIGITAYSVSNFSLSTNYEQFNCLYTNDSNCSYSVGLIRPNTSNSFIMYTDYYKSKITLKPFVYSDKSKIKCIKNSNDTYTVKGTIYMYEDSDSTKRVTVGANFKTF